MSNEIGFLEIRDWHGLKNHFSDKIFYNHKRFDKYFHLDIRKFCVWSPRDSVEVPKVIPVLTLHL